MPYYRFFLPSRQGASIDQVMRVGDEDVRVQGREVDQNIDLSPAALMSERLSQLPVAVPAPPALSPWKRGAGSTGSFGAKLMPSPHQVTIWPAFVTFHCAGASEQAVAGVMREIAHKIWKVDFPIQSGYRRMLQYGDGAPVSSGIVPRSDIVGDVRDWGTNDPNEYSTAAPIQCVYPGSCIGDGKGTAWSLMLHSSLSSPATPDEARRRAEHVEDIQVAVGNLWHLSRAAPAGVTAKTDGFKRTAENISTVVEGIAYAMQGRTECKKVIEKGRNPVHKMFTGSEAVFIRVATMCLTNLDPFRDFFSIHRSSLEALAEVWSVTRNPESHVPGPLVASDFDQASRRPLPGSISFASLTDAALRIAIDGIDRAGLFPTSALH